VTDRVDNTITGGVFFSAVIQGRNVTVVLPPQITPALAGLPAGSAAFTGRGPELDTLLGALAPRSAAQQHDPDAGPRAVLVTAVGGIGGIGKTELALQAAHTAVGRGWFAGGVLFVDMFGYDPSRRLTADQAAMGFVRALGIPREHIPGDSQELARLLRSVLDAYAAQGRPVLIVVDNVSDHQQAMPLLPAHPACRAIVTSRHTLGLLGARLIDLDALDADAAVQLLQRALDLARPGDRRVTDHPGDAHRLASLCGGLPLALRIVAALLADNPRKPLAAMVADLQDQPSRLTELSYGDDTVARAFDLSYQHLATDQARLFRLLSVNTGPDVSTAAVSVIVGLPERRTRQVLETLARAHLVEPGSEYGRWRMHDLIRLHSARHGECDGHLDQRPQALARLLTYYLDTCGAAASYLDPRVADPAGRGFATRQQAMAWLDSEYPNLTAATYAAAAHPEHLRLAHGLPDEMVQFMIERRYYQDMISLSHASLTAARTLNDQFSQAIALDRLGIAFKQVGRVDEAITAQQTAVQILHDTGYRWQEGRALTNLGTSLSQVGRLDEAIAAVQEAIQVSRDTRDRPGEGTAMGNLGSALQQKGQLDQAIAVFREAVGIFSDMGDGAWKGQAFRQLADALHQAGRPEEAIAAYEQCLQCLRDVSDRWREGAALRSLGGILRDVGRLDEAITAFQDAANAFRDTSDRGAEGAVLSDLGDAQRRAGRPEEAITAYEQGLQCHRALGDRRQQGAVLTTLGRLLCDVGRLDEAITAFLDAAQTGHDIGDRWCKGIALTALGNLLRRVGRLDEAATAHQAAARIFEDTGNVHNEGCVLKRPASRRR
jgi:tetratricopeptide (TPR) repeat protein